MANIFTAKWPFWVAGVGLPALLALGLWCFDAPLGLSQSWLMLVEYFDRGAEGLPPLDWRTALAGGIFIGALIGSAASGGFKLEATLPGVAGGAGTQLLKTLLLTVAGGFLLMAGALLAGEAPFGQLAAAIQLAPGGWLYLGGFLSAAIFLAVLLAQKGGAGGSGRKPAAKTKGK